METSAGDASKERFTTSAQQLPSFSQNNIPAGNTMPISKAQGISSQRILSLIPDRAQQNKLQQDNSTLQTKKGLYLNRHFCNKYPNQVKGCNYQRYNRHKFLLVPCNRRKFYFSRLSHYWHHVLNYRNRCRLQLEQFSALPPLKEEEGINLERRSPSNSKSAQRDSGSESHSTINTVLLKNVSDSNCEYSTKHLWTLDSGAAFHITHQKELFTELHESDIKEVYGFSNNLSRVEGEGTIYIDELDQMIPRVLYIPKSESNILSLHRLNKDLGYKAMLLNYDINLIRNGTIVAYAIPIGGVFYLKPNFRSLVDVSISVPNHESTGPERKPAAIIKSEAHKANESQGVPHDVANAKPVLTNKPFHSRCIHHWHRRLGHASYDVLSKMPECVNGFKVDISGLIQ
ncbi:uncharacterized protein [Erythrolamprus reginae]|uniref:uncharacterized protein n=1 Tax=Erythrolamprus reginae TaxID=121349 RepID=UPI00396C8051